MNTVERQICELDKNISDRLEKFVEGGVQADIAELKEEYNGLQVSTAPKEDGTTSTHEYGIGEFILFSGQLFEVTQAISVGDTLAVGVNLRSSSTGSEITNLKRYVPVYQDFVIGTDGTFTTDTGIFDDFMYSAYLTVGWPGMTVDDVLDPVMISGTYVGNLAVLPVTDTLIVYFEDVPITGATIRIYKIGSVTGSEIVISEAEQTRAIRGYLTPIFPSVNGLPNISTTDKTLTIKAPTSIFYDGGAYLIDQDQVIDLTEYQYQAKKILFNINTHSFLTAPYSSFPTSTILIALIQFDDNGAVGVAISCDYTVDGLKYGINTDEPNRKYIVESVSHRGYQNVAPENTLPAFKLARQNDFNWIETDVQFTSDNIPVIIHDRAINRTARNNDGTQLSTTINIDSITYAQALTYDFGIYKSSAYAGTRIPSFEQMIILCRNIGLNVRAELKDTVTTSKLSILMDIVKKYDMEDHVEWISFDLSLLQFLATSYPTANVGYIVSTIDSSVISDTVALRTGNNIVRLSAALPNLTDALIDLVAAQNIPLDTWTITLDSQIINANSYISSFTSNEPHAGKVLYNANIN